MSKEQLIDLDRRQLGLVEAIIRHHIPDKAVWVYGSRVTWKADERSDMDLVVFDCGAAEIIELREAFEESDLLISVDVMDWENIPENFKENIKKKYVVLQEKTELTGWQKVKLGSFVQLSKKTWKTGDEELPYIGLEHIDENKLRLNSVGSSNTVASNKYRFNASDTLFGKLRPYFRKVVKPNFDGVCSTDIWVVQSKEEVNKDFIFYFFANQQLVDISYSSSSGTRMPRADWRFLAETTWWLPPLPEQKAIAEILSSLDDKIDLLHRQNKTLEDMAQTLFRQRFVEEADEGWAEKPLGETVDISIGRTPPRKEFQWFSKKQGDWKWISIKDMAENGAYIFDTSEYLTKEAVEKFNIPVIPSNTVILSFKMTIGRVCITTEDMLSNEAIASFKFRSDTPYNKAYLYFYLKTFRFETLGSTSSIVTSINTGMIKSFIIPIPNAKLIEKFENTSTPLFSQIRLNQGQLNNLKNLRDTLLPKLISGKIRLKNFSQLAA